MEIVSSTEMKAASRYKWRMAHPKRHRAIVFVPYYNNQSVLKKKKKLAAWQKANFHSSKTRRRLPFPPVYPLCVARWHTPSTKGVRRSPTLWINATSERIKKKTRRSQHFLIATYLMPKPEWVQWSAWHKRKGTCDPASNILAPLIWIQLRLSRTQDKRTFTTGADIWKQRHNRRKKKDQNWQTFGQREKETRVKRRRKDVSAGRSQIR